MAVTRSLLPRALALAAALSLSAGCGGGTRVCRTGTLFITLSYNGAASSADSIDVGVTIDGTTRSHTFPRSGGGATDTVEVTFPSGFPQGKQASVGVVARAGGAVVGTGSTQRLLDSTCAAVAVAIGASSGDLTMPLVDAAGQDAAGQDASTTPDLAVLEDLAGRDLQGTDLTAAPIDQTVPPVDLRDDQQMNSDAVTTPPDAAAPSDAAAMLDATTPEDFTGVRINDFATAPDDVGTSADLLTLPDFRALTNLPFLVLRVGDGTTALSSVATAGFLEKRALDGTPIGPAVAIPTAANTIDQPLTFSGSATSEGNLSRSVNGAYVTFAGYAAPPGTASVSTSTAASINRVVGRINAAGVIETSTRIDNGFSGSVRSATSVDGTAYWVSGVAGIGFGGVFYIPHGTVGGTSLLSGPSNIRFDHIYAGQLYATSGTVPLASIFTVGSGLQTMGGQTATALPGTGSSGSPYSFVLLDRDNTVAGVDVAYIADDRNPTSGGGVQKWTFDGSTWTQNLAFQPVGLLTGTRGLAGAVTGSFVTLIAATGTSTSNSIVVIVDDGTTTPPAATVATAAANTTYRGIALAPF